MDTIYLSLSKKNVREEGAILIYGDEASFRQSPTLHATWAPLNSHLLIPTKGQRNTQKIFGAISLYKGKFVYKHQEEYFNSETYIDFLENYVLPAFYKKNHRIYFIQDNASYHKKEETYLWFKNNRKYIEIFCLPPYYPELNATERIWWYTRKQITHNKYFDNKVALCDTLFSFFNNIQNNPKQIYSLLKPFF